MIPHILYKSTGLQTHDVQTICYHYVIHIFLVQLRREFRSLLSLDTTVASLMDSWPQWREKLLKVAKVESVSRKRVKFILSQLENKEAFVHWEGER